MAVRRSGAFRAAGGVVLGAGVLVCLTFLHSPVSRWRAWESMRATAGSWEGSALSGAQAAAAGAQPATEEPRIVGFGPSESSHSALAAAGGESGGPKRESRAEPQPAPAASARAPAGNAQAPAGGAQAPGSREAAIPRPSADSGGTSLGAGGTPPLAAYERSRWVQRQEDLWRQRCACEHSEATQAVPALYADLPKVLVLDLRDAKWNGLGNSLPRWVDMLRLGAALGRATFLLLSDCALERAAVPPHQRGLGEWDLLPRRAFESSADAEGECQFDLGAYFESQPRPNAGGRALAGLGWRWDTAARARVHAAMAAQGVGETRVHWCNYSATQVRALLSAEHAGCREPPPRYGLGGRCHFEACAADTLAWLREGGEGSRAQWLYLDGISQLDSAAFAQIRRQLGGGRCGEGGSGDARTFACTSYGWLRPTPLLQARLLPYLSAFETADALVTVHVRSRFVDFAGQEHGWEKASARKAGAGGFRPDTSGWAPAAHVDGIEEMLLQCGDADPARVSSPCAYHAPQGGKGKRPRGDASAPFLEDPSRCGDGLAAAAWRVVTRHDGPIGRALTCAGRLAHTLARGAEPSAFGGQRPWWAARRRGGGMPGQRPALDAWRAQLEASAREPGGGAASSPRWGLFVMSDAPAVMQFVNASAQLARRAVQTHGALAHNTYGRACGGTDRSGRWLRCERGEDPGGGWTRIVLDLALASLTDGLVGVPKSTFQDAVHMRSFTSKGHFLAFGYDTRAWTRREFRRGIVDVLQGVRPREG